MTCILGPACGGVTPGDPDGNGPVEIASVRLFDGMQDITGHIFLVEDDTIRMEVGLYAANGERLLGLESFVTLEFAFSPESLAVAIPVTDAPLTRNVTPTSVSGTGGTLTVVCTDSRTNAVVPFGPFEALVHGAP